MSEHAADEHHEVHSKKYYQKIYWLLLGLLIVSILGPLISENLENRTLARLVVLTTAFGIAIYKAFLVCKHFMHLDVQRRFVLYILGTMLAFVFIFFAAVAPDVMKHEGRNWTNVSAQAEVERGMKRGEVVHHDEEHAEDEHAEEGH